MKKQIENFIELLDVMKSKSELLRDDLSRDSYYRRYSAGIVDGYGFVIIMLNSLLDGTGKITKETIEQMKKSN